MLVAATIAAKIPLEARADFLVLIGELVFVSGRLARGVGEIYSVGVWVGRGGLLPVEAGRDLLDELVDEVEVCLVAFFV